MDISTANIYNGVMEELTSRQKEIIYVLIRIYADDAEPVSSASIAALLQVSSATIRNELFVLEQQGYLKQFHTSGGRVPTEKAYRLFVNTFPELEPKFRTAEFINKRIQSFNDQSMVAKQKMIHTILEILSTLTENLGFIVLNGFIHFSGFEQLFSKPEIKDNNNSQSVARFLDEISNWLIGYEGQEKIKVFIGLENQIGRESDLSLIIGRLSSSEIHSDYLGIIGPTRQHYQKTIGIINYLINVIEEVNSGKKRQYKLIGPNN